GSLEDKLAAKCVGMVRLLDFGAQVAYFDAAFLFHFAHGGILDFFAGVYLALWQVPLPQTEDEEVIALAIFYEATTRLNRRKFAREHFEMRVRIGVQHPIICALIVVF